MGNALYAQAVGVLLLFAFLICIFLASKYWRWHHVTALVLLFFSSLFFVFLAASVLKNHSVWRTRYQQMAKELEQEQQKTQDLKFGPLGVPDENAPVASILHLENELQRIILDRGRVWRDVQLTNAQGNQITFRFADRNLVGLETAPPLHRLQPATTIYGFKEKEGPDGWKVPAFFMGEFVVQSVTADSAVVTPSLPMDRFQTGEVRPDGVTWAFYEVMPNDAHHKFDGLTDEQIRELLSPGGWHGRPPMAPPERYQETVAQYLRDGDAATDDDPPDRTWVEVELTQAWKVDVDATEAATVLPTRDFDVGGLALTPQLRQGAPSEFEPGDRILLDAEAAERWIAQGIAKRTERPTVYKRPLRDYAYLFNEIARRLLDLDESIRLTTRANTTVQQAIDKAKQQIATRTDEKTKLTEDLGHVSQEREAMTQYHSTLQGQFGKTRASLSSLYNENLKLADRLRRIHEAVNDAVRQQLADATR